MPVSDSQISPRWCIVVTDAAGPEWRLSDEEGAPRGPVQYSGLGEPATILQRSLHRAGRIAPMPRVMVTAAAVDRPHWQGALWSIRPEHRFVTDSRGWSSLTTAAAVLTIAAHTPSALITILPARSYVADEWALTVALHRALSDPSVVVDGVVTLGMVSTGCEVDEDYLFLGSSGARSTSAVSGVARRPVQWVSHYLAQRGALVASSIYVGYASHMVASLYKSWPNVTDRLARYTADSVVSTDERYLPSAMVQGAVRAEARPFKDRPPWAVARAVRVPRCGWSGLRSQRAIERVITPPMEPMRTARVDLAMRA